MTMPSALADRVGKADAVGVVGDPAESATEAFRTAVFLLHES